MIDIYFGGAEVGQWRELLYAEGVRRQLLTYYQLASRIGRKNVFKIADHFPDDVQVMVDSGGYTANFGTTQNTSKEWLEYSERYQEFVTTNIDRLAMVTELDVLALGQEWIEEQRCNFYAQLPPDKFVPMWHAAHGDLADLCGRHPRVGITEDALERTSHLSLMKRTTGVQLHGAAITRATDLGKLPLATVASTSWLSPMKYGDTAVWAGNRMRRYPRDQRDHARKRHKLTFERAGFDADKIIADDRNELTRFTIWSWLQLEEHINMRNRDHEPPPVSDTGEESSAPKLAAVPIPIDTRAPEGGRNPVIERPNKVVLPVLGFVQSEEHEGDTVPVLEQMSMRQCDTCYIKDQCPKFMEGHECAFGIPLEIKTKDQLIALLTAMVEMQAHRILFARMVEELEGGYPDQNLSSELDRLFRMTREYRDIVDTRDRLSVQIEARGAGGLISRLFGEDAGNRARQLPGGGLTIEEANVLTAEIFDDDES